MKRLLDKFLNAKIREKLICSHIFMTLIPFLSVGIMGIMLSVQEAEKNVSQSTTQAVSQVGQTLDIYLSSVEKTANMMIEMIQQTAVGNDRWESDIVEIEKSMRIVADTHSEIAGILFAAADDHFVNTGMSRTSRDPFAEELWYQKACEDPDVMHIISNVNGRNIVTNGAYSMDDVFSIVKAVKRPDTGEIAGVLLFDVRHTIISNAIWDVKIGNDGFVFVLGEMDYVAYTPVNKIVYRIKPEWLVNEKEPIVVTIAGSRYYICFRSLEYTGWKVVSVASYDEIMGGINGIVFLYGAVLILILIFVLFVALFISTAITNPIINLRNLMKEAETGNLTTRFQGGYRDEISELGWAFNRMLGRSRSFLPECRRRKRSSAGRSLRLCRSSLSPIFYIIRLIPLIGWRVRMEQQILRKLWKRLPIYFGSA